MRNLSLKRETLSELTAQDLSAIVGAAPEYSGPACPVWDKLQEWTKDDPTILWCRTV